MPLRLSSVQPKIVPRCFCWEVMKAADHSRTVLSAEDVRLGWPRPETARVRNCLSCQGWQVNW